MSAVAEPLAAPRSRKLEYYELPGPPVRRFFLYRPSTLREGSPILASIHGIARNAAAHAYRLTEFSELYGVPILAPYFSKDEYGQYQQLEDRRLCVRSDHALLAMIDAVGTLANSDGSRLLLFGYSGGAQFAHRFAMLHPDRVVSAALASAGWYTMPDAETQYPAGLDAQGWSFERPLAPEQFLKVPFHVSVGELDVLRDESLRKSKGLDRDQGLTRVDRAHRWTKSMAEAASRAWFSSDPTIKLLRGVGHDFGASIERAGLAEWAFEHFERDAALTPCAIEGESGQ